jgi:hypothetical protein
MTFASATGGQVELGIALRPEFRVGGWAQARCRAILPGPAGDHIVLGDHNRPYEYDGGRILLAHLDESGALDSAFDPSGNGREIRLGTPDHWSSWYVADAATAPDGAALVLASGLPPPVGDFYLPGEERVLIARVEVSASQGAGSIGFNDAAVRIAERRPGEVHVYRSGGATGAVSVRYEMLPGTAGTADVAQLAGTLTWADGDASARTIPLVPVDDDATEGEESFRIRLNAATGGASLAAPEVEVTIEDDEALRALQFAESALSINEGQSGGVTITRLAATPGPVVVRYAIASELDPDDGRPMPGAVRILPTPVNELRWGPGDTSNRTVQVRTYANGNPEETAYVALADVSGTLRAGNGWNVARITIAPASAPQPPPPPPAPTGGGGGGSLSPEVLALLALALLLTSLTRSASVLRRGSAIRPPCSLTAPRAP